VTADRRIEELATSTGTLYVVGTPIGNLEDLSPRARAVLGEVDLIAAEDTRRTRGLLSTIGLNTPLIAYHEHNEAQRAPQLVERLRGGESVALVSDAGTPLISDPGWVLVRAAAAAGVRIVTIPGPSALTAALAVGGLPTDRFVFEGFLPRRAAARSERLRQLSGEARTMVFYESVHRVAETLAALEEALGAERPAVLARELTKLHEQIRRGTVAELRRALAAEEIPLKGEFVLLVAGRAEPEQADEADAKRLYALLSRELPPNKAVALTAEITGLPRNSVYRLVRLRVSAP
jgi:16S rRNA (cytidine1402-2'-O)-methyltransferase